MDIASLDRDGFVRVQYPPALREKVVAAMDSWKHFCSLPPHEKVLFLNDDRIRDFGYMIRQDKGLRADSKELFHVSKEVVSELRERAASLPDKRSAQFIDAIDSLLNESQPLIGHFARAVEARYGLTGFESEVMKARDSWTYRYLHYFGGNTLAHAHPDRGGFTLHLHESHPGGEYLGFDGSWKPWPLSETETIIFPSMVLQHRSQSKLKALWHRVGSTEPTKTGGRYAMVAFIDFSHPVRYNDSVTRLQEFEPGFNYDLPFKNFQKLFVPS